jgi:hypothetical protein
MDRSELMAEVGENEPELGARWLVTFSHHR